MAVAPGFDARVGRGPSRAWEVVSQALGQIIWRWEMTYQERKLLSREFYAWLLRRRK